ncbi:MAG TPA: hypothetical protein VHY76_08340 [Acetobacteraceae bacterium]|nr:hypothetical protein [Acetobacteraceae bacterium]
MGDLHARVAEGTDAGAARAHPEIRLLELEEKPLIEEADGPEQRRLYHKARPIGVGQFEYVGVLGPGAPRCAGVAPSRIKLVSLVRIGKLDDRMHEARTQLRRGGSQHGDGIGRQDGVVVEQAEILVALGQSEPDPDIVAARPSKVLVEFDDGISGNDALIAAAPPSAEALSTTTMSPAAVDPLSRLSMQATVHAGSL